MKENQFRCPDCQWYEPPFGGKPPISPDVTVMGMCRLEPPTVLPSGKAAWPLVSPEDWCGQLDSLPSSVAPSVEEEARAYALCWGTELDLANELDHVMAEMSKRRVGVGGEEETHSDAEHRVEDEKDLIRKRMKQLGSANTD